MEQEIGRFGIFPASAFRKELASGGPIKLNVYLVPSKGEGSGARLEISGAEIR
jgi:hypothetical protein